MRYNWLKQILHKIKVDESSWDYHKRNIYEIEKTKKYFRRYNLDIEVHEYWNRTLYSIVGESERFVFRNRHHAYHQYLHKKRIIK